MKNIFEPAKYAGKWAILDTKSRVYYFIKGGKRAAIKKADELNR